MVNAIPAEREGSHGLAIFAAAAFLLGVGLIAVLERVGAPDGLVQALGPLLALFELGVIGVMTRAPTLLDFLAARRSAPTLYGALAFAATAAGIGIVMASASAGASPMPWRGVAVGLAIAALIVAPGVRGANASALGDVLATGFPAAPTRVAFALAIAAMSLLTAIAGFDLAAGALVAAIRCSRGVAEALVMLAVAVSIVPGGLKGLVWSDAACGGGALLIAALGAAFAVAHAPAPLAPLEAALEAGLVEPARGGGFPAFWRDLAAAAAVAGFFASTPPAIAAASIGHARRVGLEGLLFATAGLALAGIALPYFEALPAGPSRTSAGLIAAATWLPALALARAGVLGVTRSAGFDLTTVYSRLGVLASRRIALNRLGMLATIALCRSAADARFPDAGRALFYALAIGLAFITPALLLTMIRAGASSAMAAFAAGLLVAATGFAFAAPAPPGPDLLLEALIVGAASLAAGAAFPFVFPRAERRTRRPIADPFVDIPLDVVD